SRKIIANWGQRVLSIRGDELADLSAAFQSGLDASHGDWVCFLDSEQVLVPSAIQKGLVFGRDSLGRMHALSDWYDNIVRSVVELTQIVSPRQTVILVDQQQWEITGTVAGRRVLPFLEKLGGYSGPPADDVTAIRELERMKKHLDARFIAFGGPAFWWLDYYWRFAKHLRAHFHCVLENERLIVFDLRTSSF
ncbi:MAG TPA: glycosyltransferase family A protein, partial [Verrucomicrobiae bacterium]|nr:glycosyltransferase family A protein [Verrucomicrobiae bacterium]